MDKLTETAGCHRPAAISPIKGKAMTIAQFCGWAGITKTTVYKEIASGRLVARKIGRKTIITHDDAEAWFGALPKLVSRAS